MTERIASTYYMLKCSECGGPDMPFGDYESRADWWSTHTAATGHVIDGAWEEVRLTAAASSMIWGEPAPISSSGQPIHELVMVDLQSRAEMGLRKYGTYLQAHNGRNALKDHYEELLDAAMYIRQLLEEME